MNAPAHLPWILCLALPGPFALGAGATEAECASLSTRMPPASEAADAGDASSTRGAANSAGTASPTRGHDEDAPRHVLLLARGGVLRGPAVRTELGYDVRTRDGWRSVPTAELARVRLERDSLAEYARLARGLERDDPVRRLALATWLADEGLAPELLRELDLVLAARPDDERARALLASPALADALPERGADARRELERAFRESARATPALRELWIRRAGEAGDALARERALVPSSATGATGTTSGTNATGVTGGTNATGSTGATCPADAANATKDDPLVALARRELAQGVDARRANAARVLRRLRPGAATDALLPLALADRSRVARDEARLALRDARSAELARTLASDVDAAALKQRIGAIDTLGVMQQSAALPALVAHLASLSAPPAAGAGGGGGIPRSHLSVRRQVAYTQDYDVEIAQAASIADPVIGYAEEGVVLDVAAATWQLPVVLEYERAITCRALARIVGDGARRKPADWLAWWERRRAELDSRGATNGGR